MKKKRIKQFKPHVYKEKKYNFNKPIYRHLSLIRQAVLWYFDQYKIINHSEMAVLFNISRERIRQIFQHVKDDPDIAKIYCDVIKKYFSIENLTQIWEKYK